MFNSEVVLRVAQHCRLFKSTNLEIIVRSHGISSGSSRKFHRRLRAESALAHEISLARTACIAI